VAILVAVLGFLTSQHAAALDCSTAYSMATTQAEVDALAERCGW
jgi:hypothetical protein